MIERIIQAFNKNMPTEKREATWDWCLSYQKEIPITTENLDDMANNNLCFGFFGGSYLINTDESHIWRAEYSMEQLARILGTKNDLDSIEEGLGFKIKLPQFIGGRNVIKTERGIITDRHCHYLLVMKRILELCPDRDSAIIEIGAGLGLLAYFLDQEGYKDYTSIDLVYPGMCQSYFLNKNLPQRKIILSGEKYNPLSKTYKTALKLLHANDFRDTSGRFDIMINMDSFVEMTIDEATKYINSSVPLLLSINRENYNFNVSDIALNYKKRIYRNIFTLRNDSMYYEELYQ